jgi:hypothetical protein
MGDKISHFPEPLKSKGTRQYGNVKSIVPTHTAFQVGLHCAGACRIDAPLGCPNNTQFCYMNGRNSKIKGSYYHKTHYFDEWVYMSDSKLISLATEGGLYHYQIHRPELEPNEKTNLTAQNVYTAQYFKPVIAALRKRRLDLLVDIPYHLN